MTQKILVSKIGKDATKSNDENDFIFNSDYNTLKIIKTGTATFTVSDNDNVPTDYTIAHNLAYIPFAIGFARYGSLDEVVAPNNNSKNASADNLGNFTLVTDKSNIIFRFMNDSGENKTVKVRYYIFETPL